MDRTDSELLEAYRPRLRFDSQASSFNVSAATITDNPPNRLVRRRRVKAAASGVPMLSLEYLATYGDQQLSGADPSRKPPGDGRDRIHRGVDHLAELRNLLEDPDYANRCYGRPLRHGGRVYLQYWLWFYNTLPMSIVFSNPFIDPWRMAVLGGREYPDEGVWRLIQVELRGETPYRMVVENVDFEARPWEKVELDEHGAPQVYVSPYEHNLFFATGAHRRQGRWDGSDGAVDGGRPVRVDFGPWKEWPGRWGATDSACRSPARQSSWKRPQRLAQGSGFVRWWRARVGRRRTPVPKPPRMPRLDARLERGRVVLVYQCQEESRPSFLFVTVHARKEDDGDDAFGPVIGLARVTSVDQAGEVYVPLHDSVDCCDVLVSALSGNGERRTQPIMNVAANEPDELESKIFDSELNARLRSPDVARYFDSPSAKQEAQAEVKRQARAIWATVAAELQSFRDARVAQSRRDQAARSLATATRRGAVAVAVLLAGLVLLVLVFTGGFLGSRSTWVSMAPGLVWGVVFVSLFALQQWNRRQAAQEELQRWPDVGEGGDEAPLADARRKFERVLREKGIAPVVRRHFNQKSTKRYDAALAFGDEGLQELRTPEHEVDTAATERLEELTKRMRGGSIGIAGPRGVGKSTLIDRYCRPKSTNDRRLTTVLAAPARYDARDFVLTLFAQLCSKVLAEDAGAKTTSPYLRITPRHYVALLLFFLAGVLGWMAEKTSNDILGRWVLATAGVVAVLVAVGALLRVRWRAYIIPGCLFLIVAAAAVVVVAELVPVGWAALLVLMALIVLIFAVTRTIDAARWPVRTSLTLPEDQLRDEAERCLGEIRYQQTYSEGYSGKLSLPVGTELSVDRQHELATKQASFPELVVQLREFLGLAVKAREHVAIGIDEMDKMESAEEAQQFLNEIKGIFGVERCYFLVSISEGALSSFERRGLPFRDVFDSAFDEVLTVKPLSLRDSKALLRGRVVGLGPAYMDLCHCLSGGLARDLLRTVRHLSLYNGMDLRTAEVGRRLVRTELERKVEAATVAARELSLEPQLSELLFWMRSFPATARLEPSKLRALSESLPQRWERVTSDRTTECDKLEQIRAELAAFTYYLAAVLEVFTGVGRAPKRYFEALEDDDRAGRNGHPGPAEGGRSLIDQLARARTAFADNPRVAVAIVDSFREAHRGATDTFSWKEMAPRSDAGYAGAVTAPLLR